VWAGYPPKLVAPLLVFEEGNCSRMFRHLAPLEDSTVLWPTALRKVRSGLSYPQGRNSDSASMKGHGATRPEVHGQASSQASAAVVLNILTDSASSPDHKRAGETRSQPSSTPPTASSIRGW